ncbi:hypothetical protein SAMN05444362_109146 [Dysgonomonas macrotermitis]|uniref:Uncharacterized protein n=1 Tax=Dysgonomonas macrotermitis TaxID=1346286 RepID=A0A1M5E4N1_9BACT|nr:hypothetical protein SAMN05444362_109146 [Dysgonomonas macrotermitis]
MNLLLNFFFEKKLQKKIYILHLYPNWTLIQMISSIKSRSNTNINLGLYNLDFVLCVESLNTESQTERQRELNVRTYKLTFAKWENNK